MDIDERSRDPEGEGVSEFEVRLPSDLRIIDAAVAYLASRCRAFGFAGSRLNLNFQVGVTEAIANAILYGNAQDPAKTVRLEVSLCPDWVELCVIDQGQGFDPDAVPDPTLPPNLNRPGGRGLFLIRKLMDEVEYNERGNAVRLRLLREPPPRPRSSRE